MANKNRKAWDWNDPYNLTDLKSCLESIIAAITQQSEKGLSKTRYVGRFIGGKVAGVTAMSAFYSAVATFGTASTGTAIGSLSGAAAANATLYWIGGLVGGGVAAGATVMTFGAAAIGAGFILVCSRLFGTKPRKLETLTLTEKRILCSCDILLRSLEASGNQSASRPSQVSLPSERHSERHLFSKYGIQPLLQAVASALFSDSEKQQLKQNLTRKHWKKLHEQYNRLRGWSVAFSRTYPHKPSFKRHTPIRRRTFFLVRLWNRVFNRGASNQSAKTLEVRSIASSAICITIQALHEGRISPMNFEQSLVIDALRRADASLRSANAEQLTQYIRSLEPEQLTKLISTTEAELHQDLLNQRKTKSEAVVLSGHVSTQPAPGYDIEYAIQNNQVIWAQITNKANPDLLHEHLQRYPEASIRASETMAAIVHGLRSNGFRNYVMNFKAVERLVEFKSEGFIDSITDELVSSSFVIAAATVHSLLVEKQSPEEALNDALVVAGIVAGGAYLSDMVSDFFGLP